MHDGCNSQGVTGGPRVANIDNAMNDQDVQALAAEVSGQLEGAKKSLLERMKSLGLGPANGWRVREELRHTLGGTEWIFTPVHLREAAPDLEERVTIDHEGRLVQRQ